MSSPSPESKPSRARKWLLGYVILSVALAVIGLVNYLKMPPPQPLPDQPDLAKATQANVRGIGLMDQFEYPLAVEAFEEASKFAPDWTAAKINLGIALLNTQTPANLDRALAIFTEVLKQEPDNAHAQFCSGIILYHRNELTEAAKHFKAVTKIDPRDAQAWYMRGRCTPNSSESAEAKDFFEKALKLNPYLNAARYALANHRITAEDEARKAQLLAEFQALGQANASDAWDVKYTEMGRYGEVIGTSPAPPPVLGRLPMFESLKGFTVNLAAGTTWVTDDKLDESRKHVRTRFGGTILLLDYNRDGKPDVLVLGAVMRAGSVCDLLLRNDGNTFTDVTAESGLTKHAGSFGGAVGDFDNDGFVDLALCGPSGLKLFRNADGKVFEDKSAAAGFDKDDGEYLTASWVDLDQDGDLDLVAVREARLVVFANVGEAPPAPPGQLLPLKVAFKQLTEPNALLVKGPITGVVVTDVDGDFDPDLIVLVDGTPPVTVLNDRMLRFHRGDSVTTASRKWNGGLVVDANGDDQTDLVLLDAEAVPRVLVSKRDNAEENLAARFSSGITDSPPLRSAAWCDLDLDGRTDIVGLSGEGKPVFLQGNGTGRFAKQATPFGPDAEVLPNLLAVLPVDLDGDGNPDVLAWSASSGLHVLRSLGNGNKSLRLTLTGARDKGSNRRTNSDGIGSWVRIHAGPLRTGAENTTLFAGLGQSRLPLHFGLGKENVADVVRVRWPDAVPQAELNLAVGDIKIAETNRKGTSCPILFAWNGERFAYITDMLGAGSMGEGNPDGSTRPPRPEESVKIEAHQLAPRNGRYSLKIAEPMDEVMYLDKLRLDVIDHPAEVSVFPDERFATSVPQPSQELLYFRDSERIFATKATDHKGRDVTATLRERNGKHVDGFAVRSWLGYAEEHFVELDFAGHLKKLPAGRKVYLVLAGWTDYPYPESIYAATQADVPTIAPILEQKQADGTWKNLGEIGFPAGLTRVMTADVTGWIDPNGGSVRIRTNIRIYWDQLFIAPLADTKPATPFSCSLVSASLEHRGFAREHMPGGKLPIAYDYDRLESVSVSQWKGNFTRLGDVTELLREQDDRHVICGPGDEVTVEFDAATPPELKTGWKRSFVLRSWGYCKDTALTTVTGANVSPLPYRGMPHYPYDPVKHPPPATVTEYDRTWNTRPAGKR
ncbi:MAG: FG-GAP-like repeat-containing protein [Planctomycetes bacterium]|nr:FG-GAP-like repeat-containing protein [Planctomycetota bacterium]